MKIKPNEIEEVIKSSVDDALKKSGFSIPKKEASKEKTTIVENKKDSNQPLVNLVKDKISSLKEALLLVPKTFLNKTEKLSERTKEAHEALYKGYIDAFNKASIKLDSANLEDANSNCSDFRSLKMDVQYNMNAIKLHELYFANIGDLASEITFDSIPYIKLNQSFGTFEKWQYDFISSCMSSREGWAITYYEPFKNTYMTCVVDSHNIGLPVGCIPIIVMDMWTHSYYKEYTNDKKAYVVAMMRELNWNVIEARMVVAERSEIGKLYQIIPLVNSQPEVMLSKASVEAMPAPVEPVTPQTPQNGSPVGGQP